MNLIFILILVLLITYIYIIIIIFDFHIRKNLKNMELLIKIIILN